MKWVSGTSFAKDWWSLLFLPCSDSSMIIIYCKEGEISFAMFVPWMGNCRNYKNKKTDWFVFRSINMYIYRYLYIHLNNYDIIWCVHMKDYNIKFGLPIGFSKNRSSLPQFFVRSVDLGSSRPWVARPPSLRAPGNWWLLVVGCSGLYGGFLKWWYLTTMGFPTKKWSVWGVLGVPRFKETPIYIYNPHKWPYKWVIGVTTAT